jgi:hypothetical protein
MALSRTASVLLAVLVGVGIWTINRKSSGPEQVQARAALEQGKREQPRSGEANEPLHACTAWTADVACGRKGANCGLIGDGCGGSFDCGTCPLPQKCGGAGVPNECGLESNICVPKTCMDQGFNCGSATDGCGQTMFCGGCVKPNTCGGDGRQNICG